MQSGQGDGDILLVAGAAVELNADGVAVLSKKGDWAAASAGMINSGYLIVEIEEDVVAAGSAAARGANITKIQRPL